MGHLPHHEGEGEEDECDHLGSTQPLTLPLHPSLGLTLVRSQDLDLRTKHQCLRSQVSAVHDLRQNSELVPEESGAWLLVSGVRSQESGAWLLVSGLRSLDGRQADMRALVYD